MNDEKRERVRKWLRKWGIIGILIGVGLSLIGFLMGRAELWGWCLLFIPGGVIAFAGLLGLSIRSSLEVPEYLKQPYEPPHVEFVEGGGFTVLGGSLAVANPPMWDWRRQAVTVPFANGEWSVRLEVWWPSNVSIVAVEVVKGIVSEVLSTEEYPLLTEIGHVVIVDSGLLEAEDALLREVERADEAARKGPGWAFLFDLSGRKRGILTLMPPEESYEVAVTRGPKDGVRVTCTNLSAKDEEEEQAAKG